MIGLRQAVAAAVRRRMRARGLTVDEVAQRAGVHPRTVERLVEERTLSEETVDKVALALGIDLEIVAVATDRTISHQNAPERTTMDRRGPAVAGWEQAAQVLGVHRNTLRRWRRRAGDHTAPAWESREAVFAWARGLGVQP